MKHVLLALFVLVGLIAVCGVCMGDPVITWTANGPVITWSGASSITREDYPFVGLQTTFSTGSTTGTACAAIYVFETPKSETAFSLEAQRYINSILGKEFSDTLGGSFEGRQVTCVDVVGVYGNDVLIMSRKMGERKGFLEKYDPYSIQNGRAVIEYLPDQLAQRLQYTPTMVPQDPTKTPTPSPTKSPVPTKTATPIKTPTSRPTQAASSSVPCLCTSDLYNCDDFSSPSAAQACYDYCKSQVGTDIHGLDRDGDGKICESQKY